MSQVLDCACGHPAGAHRDPGNGLMSWCRHLETTGDGMSERCRCAGYEANLDELTEEPFDDY